MSIKFPISAIALATAFTLAYGAIASAEAYKTSTNQVVVTGLKAKQKYDVQATNAKGKVSKKTSATTNTCGEILVNGAANYKSLIVGTETIDPATLSTKAHARCNGSKNSAATKPKSKKAAGAMSAPATGTPATGSMSPATGTPATGTPATSPMPK
jgi:hypothetical protein